MWFLRLLWSNCIILLSGILRHLYCHFWVPSWDGVGKTLKFIATYSLGEIWHNYWTFLSRSMRVILATKLHCYPSWSKGTSVSSKLAITLPNWGELVQVFNINRNCSWIKVGLLSLAPSFILVRGGGLMAPPPTLLEWLVLSRGCTGCTLSAFRIVGSCFININYVILSRIIIFFICTIFLSGKIFIYSDLEKSWNILIICAYGIDMCFGDNRY